MTHKPAVVTVDPDVVSVDEMNERTSDPEISDDLKASVRETGVVQPPLVREDTDGDYAVVIGQRRVRAAQAVESVEQIPVVVMSYTDHEALKASITENIGLFRNNVSPDDRAEALQTLWEQMGGEGVPVNSHIASELGVPRETVRTWLEPIHEDWDGTSIDPQSDDGFDNSFFDGDALGERSLAEVRRMTGGGEEGEQVAREAAENDLTQSDIQAAKELVEEADAKPYEAIRQMADDNDESDADATDTNGDNRRPEPEIQAEVTLDTTASIGLKQYAERTNQTPDAVIAEAVRWFLESEGHLSDGEAVPVEDTPGFEDRESGSSGFNTAENADSEDDREVETKTAADML